MVNLAPVSRNDDATVLTRIDWPAWLFAESMNADADWAIVGNWAVLRGLVSTGNDATILSPLGLSVGLTIASPGDDLTSLSLTQPATGLIAVDALASENDDATTLALLTDAALTSLLSANDDATTADLVPPIPVIPAAGLDEIAGTVNLVRNPSLESEVFGTDDWATSAGTLTRDNATAWAGDWSALLTATGSPTVTVQSYPALRVAGGGSYIGSLVSDAFPLSLSLRAVYSDATTDDSDAATLDAGTGSWQRLATAVLTTNPAKTLMRLELRAGLSLGIGGGSVRFDGAQIEEAVTGEATPYADGDQGDGFWWAGVPDFSVSVREPRPREGGY